MKRTLALIISLICLLALFPFSAFSVSADNLLGTKNADAAFTMDISVPEYYAPGDEVIVTVTVNNITAPNGLHHVSGNLYFNPEVLGLDGSLETNKELKIFSGFEEWENFSILKTDENGNLYIRVDAATAGYFDSAGNFYAITTANKNGQLVFKIKFIALDYASSDAVVYIPHNSVTGNWWNPDTYDAYYYVGNGSSGTIRYQADPLYDVTFVLSGEGSIRIMEKDSSNLIGEVISTASSTVSRTFQLNGYIKFQIICDGNYDIACGEPLCANAGNLWFFCPVSCDSTTYITFEDKEPIPEYDVSIISEYGGYIDCGSFSVSGGTEKNITVEKGESLTFRFVTYYGYEIDRVRVNGKTVSLNSSNSYTISSISSDIEVIAEYKTISVESEPQQPTEPDDPYIEPDDPPSLEADIVTENGVIYTLSSDKTHFNVTGGEQSVTSVTIPLEINGKPVTTISADAFRDCTKLKTISLPTSLTSIGAGAFSNCTSLKSVVIPESVSAIHEFAFDSCTALERVNFPSSVTEISSGTFYGCSALKEITIPNSITTIHSSAFENCSTLKSITIPDSVSIISDNTFKNCYSLRAVEIPNTITSIGAYAFESCTALTSIILPDSVKTIGEGAFSKCTNLADINIPESVNSIGMGTFFNCTNLTVAKIPNSVNDMGSNVFENCTNLANIFCESESQPSNWNSAWNAQCNATVHWGVAIQGTDSQGLEFTLSDDGTYYSVSKYNGTSTSITIPETFNNLPVQKIDSFAFACDFSMDSIVIPDSVLYIETNAIYSVYFNALLGTNAYAKNIYCEAPQQPEGWESNWCLDKSTVHWGYIGDAVDTEEATEESTNETTDETTDAEESIDITLVAWGSGLLIAGLVVLFIILNRKN